MRTQNNLGLASLVSLAATVSAREYLTGSGGVYPTNTTCNGTTYGPTGPAGTSPASTNTTSRCLPTTSLLTYGSGGTYPTNKTCNGTTYSPTAPTGTSPGSTNTTSRCVSTTSLLTYEALTVTSTLGYTETNFGNGPYISGDTLMPVDGTATAFVTVTATSTIPETSTAMYAAPGSLVIAGSTVTVTAPTPAGFLPVQSTLPNATYGYKNSCYVSTTVITSTFTLTSEIILTTTITGPIIQTNTTAFPLSQFTDFSVVIATTTTTTEVYEGTAATTFFGPPQTFQPDPVTEYPACATNNFADAVMTDAVRGEYINELRAPGGYDALRINLVVNNPRDCCIAAIEDGYDVWFFSTGYACGYALNLNRVCAPESKNATAIATNRLGATNIIIGNALCARFTAFEVVDAS